MDAPSAFHLKAAAAASRVLSSPAATDRCPAEVLAATLTSDVPTIDSAVKSYVSLVAARSMTASWTDRASPRSSASASTADTDTKPASSISGAGPKRRGVGSGDGTAAAAEKCVFSREGGGSADPNMDALRCARSLLRAVNGLSIPEDEDDAGGDALDREDRLERQVARIVWNGLASKGHKPSKMLGRRALRHAYPHVLRRLDDEAARVVAGGTAVADGEAAAGATAEAGAGPAVAPLLPAGVDPASARSFFGEFGSLLYARRPRRGEEDGDDDAALIWNPDRGAAELRRRRGRRAKRSEDAERSEAAMPLAASSGSSSVVIEKVDEKDEGGG